MKKLALLAALLFMPFVVNATYNKHHHNGYSYNNKHNKHNQHHYSNKYHHKNKHHNGSWGNPLVGHKMPKGCKWVWVKGKKETRCGKHNFKDKLAKFCAKYPKSRKCKQKPPVASVAEPAPLALLIVACLAFFFARRK